jgi:CHAD domain-containing protein
MAAAAGVAFGGDQHVLAERGELMAAERTAVRRGLAVRRAANRPPRGGRKARGHLPIVPPRGRLPLATALAVVGLGVGIALVRSQIERRSQRPEPDGRTRRKRLTRPSLFPGEPFAEGLRRVVVGQLGAAIELVEEYPGESGGEATVHEVRKAVKRVRALLRVLRGELGRKRYARENSTLRDCARRLAGARDAEVMVATLDGLLKRRPEAFAGSPGVAALRAQLLAEREAAAAGGIGDAQVRGAVAEELRAVRRRMKRWKPRTRGFKAVAPGLERLYREGRGGLRTAGKDGGGRRNEEALHSWRKRVKDLRYAAETLDRGEKSHRRVRRVAREADRLGEMLGEEHDLALLEARVRERPGRFAGEKKTRRRLLKTIARRRKRLHGEALRDGKRLYRGGPKRFAARLNRR